jgi:hypothetical protein
VSVIRWLLGILVFRLLGRYALPVLAVFAVVRAIRRTQRQELTAVDPNPVGTGGPPPDRA